MIAALIAIRLKGKKCDVNGAYKFFNQPGWNFFWTGAMSPFAILKYLWSKGISTGTVSYLPASWEPIYRNKSYIDAFTWKGGGAHYQTLSINSSGSVKSYNPYQSYTSFKRFIVGKANAWNRTRDWELARIEIH